MPRTATGFDGGPLVTERITRSAVLDLICADNLSTNTCTSDLLPRVKGIIVVDLPAWFDHEQEKNNASPSYR
jgi:hypothetical protein